MKISAQMGLVIAAIFASVCFGVAIKGFMSLGELVDPVQRSDATGFIWFWAFLGAVGIACGAVSLWVMRTEEDDRDAANKKT